MAKPKYKYLMPVNAQVFVNNANTYVDRGTLDGFKLNAANGEVGFFLKSTGAQIKTSPTSIAIGNEFFLATKRDGLIEKSIDMVGVAGMAAKVVYQAPVRPVRAVGFNGTAGTSLNNPTLAAGQTYEVKVIKNDLGVGPTSQRFYFGERVRSGDFAQDVIARIVTRVNDPMSIENQTNAHNYQAYQLVAGTATNVNIALTVANGSPVVTGTGLVNDVPLGSYIRIPNTNAASGVTTPVYKVVGTASTTTLILNTPYQGSVTSISANNAATVASLTAVGIAVTTKVDDEDFVLAASADIENANITTITNFLASRGSATQVLDHEKQGLVQKGNTTINSQYATDLADPSLITSPTGVYTTYTFRPVKQSKSFAPGAGMDTFYPIVILYVPQTNASTAGAGVTERDTVIAAIV